MGKTIISYKLLNDNFMTVAMLKAQEYCDENKIDPNAIALELNQSKSLQDFMIIYNKHFNESNKVVM